MTKNKLLLDTCAAIWLSSSQPIADKLKALFRDAMVLVSPITAWEIGILVSRQRLALTLPPELWFRRLLETPEIEQADMPARVLIASSFLPGSPPGDPADRIIAATAREFGYRVVTRDRKLLDYASEGHIQAIAC